MSDIGEPELKTAGGRAADAIVGYLRNYGVTQPTLKTIVDALVEKGHAEKTIYRVAKEMIADNRLIRNEKETYSGKTIEFLSLPQ